MTIKDAGWGALFTGFFFGVLSFFLIRGFLPNIETALQSGKPLHLVGLLIIAVFPIAAAWGVLVASLITVRIDKTLGKIYFVKKSLAKTTTQETDIQDVVSVKWRESWRASGNGSVSQHQVFLVLKDGTRIPLDNKTDSSWPTMVNFSIHRNDTKELAISARVAQFLGVAFQRFSTNGYMISEIQPTSGLNQQAPITALE